MHSAVSVLRLLWFYFLAATRNVIIDFDEDEIEFDKMISLWISIGIVVLAMIVAAIVAIMKTFRVCGQFEPPLVKGNIIFGSALDFSKHAVNYLHKCKKQHGDIFTIRLLNYHLTIIMDPHCYEAVSREKNFDFDPIQKQVNWNVFSYVLRDPKKMLKETGKTVKGELLVQSVSTFVTNLNVAMDRLAENVSQKSDTVDSPQIWNSEGLSRFVAVTAFDSIFNTVFGRDDQHPFNAETVFSNFEIFHKYFNYLWLGLPLSLFSKGAKALNQLLMSPDSCQLLARPDLSTYMRRAIEFMKEQCQTEADIKGHSLVYLHVNYNTVRLCFWTLNNILENDEAFKELRKEIDGILTHRFDPTINKSRLRIKDLDTLPVLDSIVTETIRLSSGVFMIRYIKEDTMFSLSTGKQFMTRKGDRVAMYPPAIHKDPEIFENPLEFQFDRFIDAKFTSNGNILKHPVMGFGTICPGRRYALIQLKLYIVAIIARFEMRIRDSQRAEYDCRYYGHEVLPPLNDIHIEFAVRDNFRTIELQSE